MQSGCAGGGAALRCLLGPGHISFCHVWCKSRPCVGQWHSIDAITCNLQKHVHALAQLCDILLLMLSPPAQPPFPGCRTCHIVVGTPGRLCALAGSGSLPCGGLKQLVLDEADQLMADSFRSDVVWLHQQLPSRKQVRLHCSGGPVQRLTQDAVGEVHPGRAQDLRGHSRGLGVFLRHSGVGWLTCGTSTVMSNTIPYSAHTVSSPSR
jgi:hypothetical protein